MPGKRADFSLVVLFRANRSSGARAIPPERASRPFLLAAFARILTTPASVARSARARRGR